MALVLPGASLSAGYVEQRVTHCADRLAHATNEELETIRTIGRIEIAAVESVVAPLWRGFLFAVVSLPLAALAEVKPNLAFDSLSAENVLVGASLGFVIVGVFSFLPFTWEILQLDLARETRTKMFELPQQSGSATKGAAIGETRLEGADAHKQ